MKRARLLLTTIALAALGGCGLHVGTGKVVPRSDLQGLVADNSVFALDLYGALRKKDGNLLFSPYSISTALAMTYAGARGETEKQMARTLHFNLPQQGLHSAFNLLDLEMAKRGKDWKGETSKDYRLDISNALWAQTGKHFQPAFLEVLAQNYGAGMRLVDFGGNPEAARAAINKWARLHTQGKIDSLVPKDVLTTQARLVLTNAIYFKDKWVWKFEKHDTWPGEFSLLNGNKVSVDMMHQGSVESEYARGDGWQAFSLWYRFGKGSFVVLLPDAGRFQEFEKSLNAQSMNGLMKQIEPATINLTMPRFRYESTLSLGEALSAMGMPLAFQPSADFSGMDGARDLFISAVLHKTFVSVDEEGTEAAAASAADMELGAAPVRMETIKVVVDRPFIFLIRDRETGTILFAGRVLNPASR